MKNIFFLCTVVFLLLVYEHTANAKENSILPDLEDLPIFENDRALNAAYRATIKQKQIKTTYSKYRKNATQIIYGKMPEEIKNLSKTAKITIAGFAIIVSTLNSGTFTQRFKNPLLTNSSTSIRLSLSSFEIGLNIAF